jgi:organic radical activating enzyme
MNQFSDRLAAEGLKVRRARSEILQVNVGKLCNLTCMHCHVNAGPKRKEIMTRETIERIIDWLAKTDIAIVDLTGGAPEMIPDFRYFLERICALQPRRHVIDRCNLTILLECGYEGLAEFLAAKKVEIIASMPCYSAENVDAQRRRFRLAAASYLQPRRPISAQCASGAGGRLQARAFLAFRHRVQQSLHARQSAHRPLRRLLAAQQQIR